MFVKVTLAMMSLDVTPIRNKEELLMEFKRVVNDFPSIGPKTIMAHSILPVRLGLENVENLVSKGVQNASAEHLLDSVALVCWLSVVQHWQRCLILYDR